MTLEKNVKQFDADVSKNKGYIYTTNNKLSSLMANQNQSDAIRELADLKGKKVIDVGCGDGTYTLEFLKQKPKTVLGVDASPSAVQAAKLKSRGKKNVRYQVMDIYQMGKIKEKFDVAVIRGVLHHLYDAPRAIKALSKITRYVVVVEPNGYNPVLKMIERLSTYHVEHEEKSYFPSTLRTWFRRYGGRLEESTYRGLVPMFCPDWMARFWKTLEPWVEKIPVLRQISCAVYVFRVSFEK